MTPIRLSINPTPAFLRLYICLSFAFVVLDHWSDNDISWFRFHNAFQLGGFLVTHYASLPRLVRRSVCPLFGLRPVHFWAVAPKNTGGICLSVYPSRRSVGPLVRRSICLSVCLSVCLLVCLSIHPSVSASVHPSVPLAPSSGLGLLRGLF